MAVLYTPHFIQFFDNNGDPLSGGKLYTYSAGTTTPKDTYTTAAASVSNTNPVVLDSAGRAVVFLSGSYKLRLEDSLGNLIKETDNVTAFSTQSSTVDDIVSNFISATPVFADNFIFADVSDSNTTRRSALSNIVASTSEIVSGGSDKLVSASNLRLTTPTIGGSVATTSGASVDISTAIPSGVRSIMLWFKGVSSSGTSNWIIQLGSASFTTSGYVSNGSRPSVLSSTSTAGILALVSPVAAETATGCVTLNLVNSVSNEWHGASSMCLNGANGTSSSGGYVSLSGAIDRIRITTVGGADTFDSGSIFINYV